MKRTKQEFFAILLGTYLFVSILACGGGGGGASPSTAPDAPNGLSATVVSSSKINLLWTDNSSNEEGFKIERKLGSGTYTEIASVGSNVSIFEDTGLIESTTYYYRVRAYNSKGFSSYSNEANATTVSSLSAVFQGFGPYAIAATKDGQFAYISFNLSEVVLKVRLADLTVAAAADLSGYFPLEGGYLALNASENKLFVHTRAWRKLLVLDTQTMGVIHVIDNIVANGIIRSQYGPYLIIWGGGNTVKFVNTETYSVTEFTDLSIGFLQIRESPSDPSKWYVATQLGPGAPWTIGLYSHVAKAWIHTVTIPIQGETPGIWDFKVLPNESKLYAAVIGGWYPVEYHSYGWLYSIDLVSYQVRTVPIDGGAGCLEASSDNNRLYVGTGNPIPSENNLLVVDTQSDSVIDQIYLGHNKYGWHYIGMNDLQIDPANPNLLYGTSTDGNALIKARLDNLTLVDVLVFNEESFRPHFFAKRPLQATGYVLIENSAYTFELDLDSATIRNVIRFPAIHAGIGAYDVAITNAGRLLIAQGDEILEVDGANMSLIAKHPLPANIQSVREFVLSTDQGRLYSITNDPITNRPNVFLAINAADFEVLANFALTGGAFDSRPFELPDGSKLYALGGEDFGTIVIHVIRTDNFAIQKTITFNDPGLRGGGVSGGPYYPFAYDSSSHTLYVGATEVVLAIDTVTDVVKKVIHLSDVAGAIGLEPYQFTYVNAIGLVYRPQENYLYIAHLDRSFISIYDLNNSKFLSQVITLKGFFPNFAFANDNQSKIYTLNIRSDSVSVIDVPSKTVEKVIDLHDYLK